MFELPSTRLSIGEIGSHTSLRGIAALLVVLYHCALARPGSHLGIIDGLIRNGFVFVDLFFMLSGYILYYQYRSTLGPFSPSSAIRYLALRVIRIYPPYLIWLFVSFFLWLGSSLYFNRLSHEYSELFISLLSHILMIQGILGIKPQFNIPLWSIAVEMVAYTALPLLVLILYRPLSFAVAIGILLGLGFCAAEFISSYGTLDVTSGYGSVARCIIGFSIGVVLSELTLKRLGKANNYILYLFYIAILSSIVFFSHSYYLEGYISFMGVVLLGGVFRSRTTGIPFSSSVFIFFGRVSFSIYLAHVPVLVLLIPVLAKLEHETGLQLFSNYFVFSSIVALVSIVIAVPSYNLLEVRLREWLKNRYLGARQVAAPTTLK